MITSKLASQTPTPLLAGFNNSVLVFPREATNRHERRELKKTGTIRRAR